MRRLLVRSGIIAGTVIYLSMVTTLMVSAKEITIDAKPVVSTESTTESITTEQTTEKASSDKIVAEPVSTTEVPGTTEEQTETDDETNGKWNKKKTSYYVDGEKVKGWYDIDDKLYYFSNKGKLYTKTGLKKIGKKTYYFNDDHYAETGVVKVDGKVYYFREDNGARLEKTGVASADDNYYCVKDDYTLKKGWYRDKDGNRYYFNKKTYEAYSDWNYVGKYKYYFEEDGKLLQDVRDKLTKSQKKNYSIRVNRSGCCVTVYAKDGIKGYKIPVVSFVCSSGKDTPTGSFSIKDKLRWHELMGPCWGQWSMHLTSDILFHSVYYDKERDNKSLNVGAYNRLGTMASHGCIRMTAGDCKWIYDNCKVGTKVVIYNSKKSPGPFDKPKAEKLSASHTWDPTDPAFKDKK